jgi:hypothetical protein
VVPEAVDEMYSFKYPEELKEIRRSCDKVVL